MHAGEKHTDTCHFAVTTLSHLSQVSDSIWIANHGSAVQQDPTVFICKPLLFLGKTEAWH